MSRSFSIESIAPAPDSSCPTDTPTNIFHTTSGVSNRHETPIKQRVVARTTGSPPEQSYVTGSPTVTTLTTTLMSQGVMGNATNHPTAVLRTANSNPSASSLWASTNTSWSHFAVAIPDQVYSSPHFSPPPSRVGMVGLVQSSSSGGGASATASGTFLFQQPSYNSSCSDKEWLKEMLRACDDIVAAGSTVSGEANTSCLVSPGQFSGSSRTAEVDATLHGDSCRNCNGVRFLDKVATEVSAVLEEDERDVQSSSSSSLQLLLLEGFHCKWDVDAEELLPDALAHHTSTSTDEASELSKDCQAEWLNAMLT